MSCWYTKHAPEDDVVISSRIRLARNIKGLPFPAKMSAQQYDELNDKVKKVFIDGTLPYCKSLKFIYMKDIPEDERYAMVERHIISREFASNYENRAIIISDDEEISIMVGEEDHIRIQVIKAGLDLDKAYEIARDIDSLLNSNLDIAFDDNLGFLTECPTNLGTGLRASVMLHLPVTEGSSQMNNIVDSINKVGFTVRGMYGEGTKAQASFYQISNQITLGISEKSAIDNLKIITMQLVENERTKRNAMNKLKVEDLSMRALGILKNARIIDSNEMMKLLSDVKLGMSLGIIDNDMIPIQILIECQPYMLMRKFGRMTADERDIYRAGAVRKFFA